MPFAVRRGTANVVCVTSACTSAISGRVPSMTQTAHAPETPRGRSDISVSDGLSTCTSPVSVISKTPISFVEPKRFLMARIMR